MSDETIKPPTPLEKYRGTPRVSMSNALVRAAHGLSIHEKRLVALCVSKLDSARHWTPEKLVVRVTAQEYQETFGIPHDKHIYRDLKQATQALKRRLIVFHHKDIKTHKLLTSEVSWVGRATYADGEGWVELAFWHELAPHLFKLKARFTTYHLKQASALRSTYSWGLLELLMQFHKKQRLFITLEDLHHKLEVPESCRKSFKDLRRRVLEPAIKELGEKDGLIVEMKPRKEGRKVVSLAFTFGYEVQGKLDLG